MLSINAVSMGSVADTIAVSADIERLGDPVGWNTVGPKSLEAIDVLGRGAAVGVDVAGESGLVLRVADEEDAFDGGEGGASQLGEGVDGCGCALGVAFEDEALVGV